MSGWGQQTTGLEQQTTGLGQFLAQFGLTPTHAVWALIIGFVLMRMLSNAKKKATKKAEEEEVAAQLRRKSQADREEVRRAALFAAGRDGSQKWSPSPPSPPPS